MESTQRYLFISKTVEDISKMTVLKYYIEEKFNPVPITFSSKKKIEAHYEKRINLVKCIEKI